MVTERTLHRKLQKKAKRKSYRKCPRCSGRMKCSTGYNTWYISEGIESRCESCSFSKFYVHDEKRWIVS